MPLFNFSSTAPNPISSFLYQLCRFSTVPLRSRTPLPPFRREEAKHIKTSLCALRLCSCSYERIYNNVTNHARAGLTHPPIRFPFNLTPFPFRREEGFKPEYINMFCCLLSQVSASESTTVTHFSTRPFLFFAFRREEAKHISTSLCALRLCSCSYERINTNISTVLPPGNHAWAG